MRRNRVVPVLAMVLSALATGAGAAQAGQIVYSHGGELWVMNDAGGGQRQLLTAAQAGGSVDFTASTNAISVQPGGTGVAFVAPLGSSCALQTSNCPATYTLAGGKLTRLTAASAACGSPTVQCGSEEESPAVTNDGRVIYHRLDTAGTFTCLYYCGFSGGYQEAFYVRKLDGSDAPVPWVVPTLAANMGDTGGIDPDFEGPIASDPVDSSVLAYQGNYYGNTEQPSGAPANAYPLDIEHSAANPATAGQPAWDDQYLYGMAFSSDGGLIADVETGNTRGIWVYPTGQSWRDTAGARFTWALKDPDDGQGGILDHYFSGLAFVGTSELVFSANYNLYAIPASCWATPTTSDPPDSNCQWPAGATQLTTDGTQAAPDTNPAWTASATPIPALATTPAPTPTPTPIPTPPAPAPKSGGDQIHKLSLAARSVKVGRSLTFDVTLTKATKITIQILRHVAASGHGKHRKKAHYSKIGSITFAGKTGLNKVKLTKVKGHTLPVAGYEALVSAGGKSHTLTFSVHH